MIIKVKDLGDEYLVNGIRVVPKTPLNSDYTKILKWIEEGGVVDPHETAEEIMLRKRREKKNEIQQLCIDRAQVRVPALGDKNMLSLVAELWPMLDSTKASADLIAVKDIVVYARQKINQLKTATEAQIDSYDPAADALFPS